MIKLINAYTLSECLDAVATEIEAYEQLGQKNIVFCEDRLTLVAERALMRRLGGTFLTEVITFSRFLKTDRKVLSREGSVMAVGEIMLELQREGALKCFTSAASVRSGAKCIYEQLAQFGASEIDASVLKESVKKLPEDMLKNKMTDLALIYERYDEFLKKEDFLDEGKYLTLLPDSIKNTPGMSEMNVFFLCYSSFTKQAKRTLCAAMDTAKNVVGIFTAGDEEMYANQAYGSFYELANERKRRGVAVRSVNAGTPLDGEAEMLRKTLFSMESLSDEGRQNRLSTDAVRIYAATDRASEAEYVAVYIRKALQEHPELHYRDFAVLTASVDEYSLPIAKAFSEYGIPYSTDERISLKQHPLAKFILAVLNAVCERFPPAAVDAIAQNVFFGEGDLYRNYLLRYANFRAGVFKDLKIPDGDDLTEFERNYGKKEYLLACKQKMQDALGLFKEKEEAFGREYCKAVRSLMEQFSAAEVLQELMAKAQNEGMRSYLAQIEKKIEGVLLEAETLAGGKRMRLEDFATLIADGLEATEIAPNPLRLDAVFVGDITDSRIERVGTLFALGMTDGVPRASDDANLITDKDKIKLQEIQAILEPMVEEVNMRNRESVCLNLCTFTDALYLTYPLGSNGEDPALSDVFRYVKAAFVTPEGLELSEEKRIPDRDFAYRCCALSPAARLLLVEKNAYEMGETNARTLFSSLYACLDEKQALPEGVNGKINPHKYIEQGEELFLAKGSLSPSTLETYFSCPYQCFASRGLALEERQEAAVLSVDTGNFIHKLLEDMTDQIPLCDDEESFAKKAKDHAMSLMNDKKFVAAEDTLAGAYSAEKLVEEGVQVARAVYRQVRDSAFDVITKERKIDTPNVHGKVDRVDENERFVRVVDYKTGTISADVKDYYSGRKIQMELYMSAVRGEKIPAGVLYFPASVSFADQEEGRYRMKGFLNGDVEALRSGDKNLCDDKQSEHFEAALTKNRSGKIMPGEDFCDFLDYGVYLSQGATQEIREGYVAPSPIKINSGNACDWCKYGGMCGFHEEKLAVRKMPSATAKQVVECVRKRKEGGKKDE